MNAKKVQIFTTKRIKIFNNFNFVLFVFFVVN